MFLLELGVDGFHLVPWALGLKFGDVAAEDLL